MDLLDESDLRVEGQDVLIKVSLNRSVEEPDEGPSGKVPPRLVASLSASAGRQAKKEHTIDNWSNRERS